MSWSDYGFTDVTLLPSTIPSMAIMKACRERARLSTNNWPLYFNGREVQIMEPVTSFLLGATRYAPSINHLLNFGVYPSEALWDQNTLRQAVFDRYPGNLPYIPPQNDQAEYIRNLYMTYDWHRDAAIQQYIFVNLQKIISVPYKVILGTWEAYGPTPEEAWLAASTTLSHTQVASNYWEFRTTFENRFQDGIRCATTQPISIEPDYESVPDLLGLSGDIYTRLFTGESNIKDDFGLDVDYVGGGYSKPIHVPYNITIPRSISSPFPLISDLQNYPYNKIYRMLMYHYDGAANSYCGVDCSSLFEFYDNVDEIPIP